MPLATAPSRARAASRACSNVRLPHTPSGSRPFGAWRDRSIAARNVRVPFAVRRTPSPGKRYRRSIGLFASSPASTPPAPLSLNRMAAPISADLLRTGRKGPLWVRKAPMAANVSGSTKNARKKEVMADRGDARRDRYSLTLNQRVQQIGPLCAHQHKALKIGVFPQPPCDPCKAVDLPNRTLTGRAPETGHGAAREASELRSIGPELPLSFRTLPPPSFQSIPRRMGPPVLHMRLTAEIPIDFNGLCFRGGNCPPAGCAPSHNSGKLLPHLCHSGAAPPC